MPLRERLARILSAAGHPFVLVPLAVLLAGRRTLPPRQLGVLLAVVGCTLLIESLYILRRVRRGAWTDFDVSVRAQRPLLYLSALLLSALSWVVLWRAGLPPPVLQGISAALGLLVVSLACNLRLKVSLHVAFDVYAALLSSRGSSVAPVLLLLLAAAVAWSRVALSRHTPPEVAVAAVLGALGGLAAICPLSG